VTLVDLPADWTAPSDPTMDVIAEGRRVPTRLARGVYETHVNFGHDIRGLILTEYPFMDLLHKHLDRNQELRDKGEPLVEWPDLPDDFGVCDTWEQITERWPSLAADQGHRYLVYLSPVLKADQYPHGGWRWHKWGPYIGTLEPRYEYLYDEPDIERVYVFQIVELKPS
jgi:hypothetical protein